MNKILFWFVCPLLVGLYVLQTPLQTSLQAQEEDKRATAGAKREPTKKESAMKGQSRELEGDWFLTREDHPVKLSATYYYGNADKETTPVLLLHDAAGSRKDFMPLITQLTGAGYAVLAPDLRGHGQSVKRYEVTPPTVEMKTKTVARPGSGGGGNRKPKVVADPVITPGSTKLVDYLAEDFQPIDYALMIRADVPLLMNTLEKVHAEGMVNLNRLVVIGVGRGAALASYIAAQNWKDKESDRFTKTLILIAPMDISAGVDTTLICDNMASSVMARGKINAVFVGCDRVARNGDTANKIGTLSVAIAAKRYGIPFYVCAPSSTIDMNTPAGDGIVIEERDGAEITDMWYSRRMAPEGVRTYNPAFDVTDSELVTAFVTERGVLRPPFGPAFRTLFA